MRTSLSRRDVLRQAGGLALAPPALLSLVACGETVAGRRALRLTGATMGTTWSVLITERPAGLDGRTLGAEIEGILETVNQQMSTYRTDSELSRFNAGAAPSWVPVSNDTRTVVEAALRVGRLTDGAFDPTVGPLVALWGFGPGPARQRVPDPAEIGERLTRIGYGEIRTDAARVALAKGRGDLSIDLAGIAKGFAVDKVAAHLEWRGIPAYLVEIGGELRSRGLSPRREAWRIGVESPAGGPTSLARVVGLEDRAIASSGDYRQFFESDGARYSHIIDPRNGLPIRHGLASVTVIADTAMRADALSTALLVLGPEAGAELAERQGLAAFFLTRRAGRLAALGTPEFERHVVR